MLVPASGLAQLSHAGIEAIDPVMLQCDGLSCAT